MDDFNPFILMITYLVFLISTTFHEASHAFAAKLGGDLTAYSGGQVSLDPMPHIRREPLGMVVFPIISLFMNGWPFGWASAPYDPLWARSHYRRAALMALAGPSANLFLAVISGLILKIGLMQGIFSQHDVIYGIYDNITSGSTVGLSKMLGITYYLNMILFVLNLLPLPGLDGSSAITILMPEKMAISFSDSIRRPGLFFLSIFIMWQIFPYIFQPIYSFTSSLIILI